MFRVSFILGDEIRVASFADTKAAMEFVNQRETDPAFTALKLLVWDEYLGCYSTLRNL
jgi:hypothetical protein